MKITKLSQATLRSLDAEIIEALTPIMEKHDLTVSIDGGSFDPNTHYTAKVKIQLVTEDGVPADFKRLAASYGLDVEDYGKEIRLGNGKMAKISGINPRRPKYLISVMELGTDKEYKVPVSMILEQLHPEKKTVLGQIGGF